MSSSAPGWAPGDHGLLARSPESQILGGAQVVDQTAFWISPRSPHAILAFVKADPPSGITSFFNGLGNVAGDTYRFLKYGGLRSRTYCNCER